MEFRPKKNLGQNFLINDEINLQIAKLGCITENDMVLEIGPGTGNLTKYILNEKPNKLILVEKDNNLSTNLKEKFEDIQIINEDFLQISEAKLNLINPIVYGNLPYNISSQILIKLIKLSTTKFKRLILMFQKEMADRILANTNSKEYGRLSIISQWKMNITKIRDIEPKFFRPVPKVKSSLLIFEPKKEYFKLKNIKNLEFVTNTFFNYRRKMIKKPLNQLFKNSEYIVKKYELNLSDRPQKLSPTVYYQLSNELESLR